MGGDHMLAIGASKLLRISMGSECRKIGTMDRSDQRESGGPSWKYRLGTE